MNKTRRAAIASRIARERICAGIPSSDDVVTGTVQHDEHGGAWVHCMVFVPPVDLDAVESARVELRANQHKALTKGSV